MKTAIKNFAIAALLLSPFSSLRAQETTVRKGTSVYVSPLALTHASAGRSARAGFEQHLKNNWSAGAELSVFLPVEGQYKNMSGFRGLGEVRHYTSGSRHWIGAQAGIIRQQFTQEGTLFEPGDSSGVTMNANMSHRAEIFRAGTGFRLEGKRGWFFDTGLWLGIRHRDTDVNGVPEGSDGQFKFDTQNYFERIVKDTDDGFLPDFSWTVRVGYRFGGKK